MKLFTSAKVLIESLIKTINPSKVLIVGRKNIEYFSKYFWDLGSPNVSWNGHKSSPHAHLTRMMDIPVIATSLYVPNPYGYGSEDLLIRRIFIQYHEQRLTTHMIHDL